MATPELPEHVQRIAALEAALRRERDRSTELEKRAALLEECAKRAYKMAAGGIGRREQKDTV